MHRISKTRGGTCPNAPQVATPLEHGLDAAEITNVHEVGAVGDVVGEREMRIKSDTKIAERGIRGESRSYCTGSGIFLICSGRPIMMNSVLEGLRQRKLALQRRS